MNKQEILDALPNFTGSEYWYRYSPLFPKVLLTDGARFVAESCGAYWLMDAISSHIPAVRDYFCVVTLDVKDRKAMLQIQDDIPARNVFARQEIAYTDFPLDQIKLYLIYDQTNWTILLPSEY